MAFNRNRYSVKRRYINKRNSVRPGTKLVSDKPKFEEMFTMASKREKLMAKLDKVNAKLEKYEHRNRHLAAIKYICETWVNAGVAAGSEPTKLTFITHQGYTTNLPPAIREDLDNLTKDMHTEEDKPLVYRLRKNTFMVITVKYYDSYNSARVPVGLNVFQVKDLSKSMDLN